MTTPTISPLDLGRSRIRAFSTARKALRRRLKLPPKLSLSQWADRYRVLSPESSAEPGQWRTARVPYMREIMDAISGREHQEILILKCSQSAGTEVLNNASGFYIDQEPSPILVIQPNVKPMAEAWSKDRLAPMLRDSPRLRGRLKDPRSRDSGNTVLHKVFAGGYLSVIGANSPAGLASRPIRVILADELDRWPASAGTEGDPLALARARTITFRHRKKVVKVTTLGNEGESRGEKEWEASDQRHFYLPCPFCGHEQPLEWRASAKGPDIRAGTGPYRVVWEKRTAADGEVEHVPETAKYQCRACEALIDETHKAEMLAAGKWVKHNPASDRAGFHIPGLISPWLRWRELASEWLLVMDDPEQRKTFFNTKLGLLYSESGEVPDAASLESRRETYAAEVPMAVGVLTVSVDVQGDRIEVEVRGWGEGEESWQVRFERFYGDPTVLVGEPDRPSVWERLQAILDREWKHESGAVMHVSVCMIDAGYEPDTVYAFVRPRQNRGVFAIRGVDNARDPLSRAAKAGRDGVKLFIVNPNKFKDTLFGRLKRQHPGRGFLHFGTGTGADSEYFRQFGAEKRTVEFDGKGLIVQYVNPKRQRNEAIDLYVYGLAALRSMGMVVTQNLGEMAERIQQSASGEPPAPEPQGVHAPAETLRQQKGGWVGGWRR